MATEGGCEAESGLVNTLQGHVDDIRSLLQCGICVRPLYEPFTIACGHTFCYSCLASWFSAGKSKRTCPDCRAPVTAQPAPAYMVRAVVQMFTSRAELLDKEETTAEHIKNHKEETDRLDKDKANKDPQRGGLFGGLFKPEQPKPYVDSGDGITRCPHCHWELEDGLNCAGCGYIFHPDSEGTDYSGSDLSDTDFDSMLDEDEDEDEEDEEDEDDMDSPRGQYGRPPNHRPPFYGFNGSRGAERQFLDQLFPTFQPFPFHFPVHPQVSNGGANHSGSRSYGDRPTWGDEEANAEWGDREEEEEEEEEEDEDSYEDSFIDDEEHMDRDDEDSQSDHSTVVGTTRQREYSPTTAAMIQSAYDAAAGSAAPAARSAAPMVRYPPVHHPNSTSELDDYGWDSEDDEEIGGRTGALYPDGSFPGSSQAGESTDWSVDHDRPEGEDLDDESNSENESDSSDLPRARVGQRRQQFTIPSSEDEDSDSEDSSSSPPRAQPPRANRPPAPRTTGSAAPRRTNSTASRATGTTARNAITIDDSDEDPVGPIRRPGQRRQPRYSPY